MQGETTARKSKAGLARANKTLRNLKSAWIQSQQVKLDGKGQSKEYRVQLKITFKVEGDRSRSSV